ncbi:hypothetical protein C4K04_2585 [Pseudomonas chlororaphis]|uniref:Uncharacterized protein n=1 Tax=Pseudomonas chlororaphis TaxID=587753 RepID=A0A3G7TP27_9PSED|nr:hypothetical protein [Pseudomonas chlororaphis]AZE48258.1 hypothetical protein C4K04_2585 [Pseudomonas chlororaphis]
MSEAKTAEQRLHELEVVVKTLILFNQNAIATVSRRITQGNPAIADALIHDLSDLKARSYSGIDKGLHDQYVDSLIAGVS